MSPCVSCVQQPEEDREGVRWPGTGVAVSHKFPHGFFESNLAPLQE